MTFPTVDATGIGLTFVNENRPLANQQKWRNVTATDAVEIDDFALVCTGGATVLTLPPCAKCLGKMYIIKAKGTGDVTIAAHGTDAPLASDVTLTYSTFDTAICISGGTFWVIDCQTGATS